MLISKPVNEPRLAVGDLRLLTALGDNFQRQAELICAIAIARPDGFIAL